MVHAVKRYLALIDSGGFVRRLRANSLRRHNYYFGLLAIFLFLAVMLRVCSLGPGAM